MNITIKTPEEIEKMRVVGKLASEVLDIVSCYIEPGVTTEELNTICHNHIVDIQKAIPAPLNYKGFPKSICTSWNHVVCHGIPSPKKMLKDGDIINIDVTVIKDGYHGDTSRMFIVGGTMGKASILAKRLYTVAYECMWEGIKTIRAGVQTIEIGQAIYDHATAANFSVVREFCGHGIGLGFHEDPQILNYPHMKASIEMMPGMTFTVEPMINAGKKDVKKLPDGWTIVTKDHSLSAQWEHTVLVTEDGYEVLTWNDWARGLPKYPIRYTPLKND